MYADNTGDRMFARPNTCRVVAAEYGNDDNDNDTDNVVDKDGDYPFINESADGEIGMNHDERTNHDYDDEQRRTTTMRIMRMMTTMKMKLFAGVETNKKEKKEPLYDSIGLGRPRELATHPRRTQCQPPNGMKPTVILP